MTALATWIVGEQGAALGTWLLGAFAIAISVAAYLSDKRRAEDDRRRQERERRQRSCEFVESVAAVINAAIEEIEPIREEAAALASQPTEFMALNNGRGLANKLKPFAAVLDGLRYAAPFDPVIAIALAKAKHELDIYLSLGSFAGIPNDQFASLLGRMKTALMEQSATLLSRARAASCSESQ